MIDTAEEQVNLIFGTRTKSYFISKAEALARGHEADIERAKQMLEEKLPERGAAVIAKMQDADCECRKKIESRIRGWIVAGITTTKQVVAHLDLLIRAKYQDVSAKLLLEFRIFTTTNAFVFGALALAVPLKPAARGILLPAAIVLALSAGMTAYVYLFHQNWIHTILFGEYIGLAYVAYLGFVFLCLSDIVFNRGRVTASCLSAVANSMGSAVSFTPC